VDGIDATTDPVTARGQIGYLPDFFGVYGGLTVMEYLDFYGALYRIPPRRRRQTGDELLELMELTDRRDQPVGALPRGMRQKLGLARCLIHDPAILLLDEPAAGMDPASRLELRDILRELASFGKAILITSHLLFELAEMCSYLGVMHDGELVTEGSVDEIRSAVLPERYLRVHLLDPSDAEPASRRLAEHARCREVESVDASTLRAWFDGDDEDLAALLGQLSRSGIRVAEFALERPTLEEVFLQMSALEAAEVFQQVEVAG
jgi:ABC-2 type transport system ATP-binding protein